MTEECKSPPVRSFLMAEASASPSPASSTSDMNTPITKKSLAWFRSRQAHWKSSPRRKIQAFPPPLAPYTPPKYVDVSCVEVEQTPATITLCTPSPTTSTRTVSTTASSSDMSSPSSITSPLCTTSSVSIRQQQIGLAQPPTIQRATAHPAIPAFIPSTSVGAYIFPTTTMTTMTTMTTTTTTSWHSPFPTTTSTTSPKTTPLPRATLACTTATTAGSTSTASPFSVGLSQGTSSGRDVVFGAGTPTSRFSHRPPCSTDAYSQRTATSGQAAARSPKTPTFFLIEDYRSIRAAHYSFDALTLPLHVYMSELSQVPIAASSKAHASDEPTGVNPDGLCAPITNEAIRVEEIKPWTPYSRRSIRSKRIRQARFVNATSFPISSKLVANAESRKMKLDQGPSSLPRVLLDGSMAMALLSEMNYILEQERHVNSENSVRVASKAATSTCDEMKLVNPNDTSRSFPIRNEPIGQVNYCCCELWL